MMEFIDSLDPRKVAIATSDEEICYPTLKPYRPSMQYPEFAERISPVSEPNPVYSLCRQLFMDLRLDTEHFNTETWNPLGGLITPGNKVLVKPNLVRHLHLSGGDYEAVVTHGSIIRCVLDYVALALKGDGEIVLGDAPVQSADFQKIIERNGLQKICDDVSSIWNIPIRLVDFRLLAVELDEHHCIVNSRSLCGDKSGYTAVNLGERSLLAPLALQHERFRVTSYDCGEMVKHHNQTVNEYLIPQAVLNADVVVSLPKLKTHRKVCLTAALKNFVGINGHKDWLPHHRCGSTEEGGDEYLRKSYIKVLRVYLENNMATFDPWVRSLSRLFLRVSRRLTRVSGRDFYEEGSWYGNDTLWRTVLDLNRLLIYADREGNMSEIPQRRCFTLVDGIIAGEGEGPMEPDSRHCGIIVAGGSQVAVDAVLATMIGFDYKKIPIILNGFNISSWPLTDFNPDEIEICTSNLKWQKLIVGAQCATLNFKPPMGWFGHVEAFADNEK